MGFFFQLDTSKINLALAVLFNDYISQAAYPTLLTNDTIELDYSNFKD